MQVVDANRHWCQPDYPTTCLVHSLRERAGLPNPNRSYVVDGFNRRSGLFFANPYMVDWALASTLTHDEAAAELRAKLSADIIVSMKRDHSFGFFDVALSSAFAILALAALGVRGRRLRIAQLRLLEFMEPDGTFPPAAPFYSTAAVVLPSIDSPKNLPPQVLELEGRRYALTLYHDPHRLVSTAVAQLALAVNSLPVDDEADWRIRGPVHPRYCHHDQADYISQCGLPPYVGTSGMNDTEESYKAHPVP